MPKFFKKRTARKGGFRKFKRFTKRKFARKTGPTTMLYKRSLFNHTIVPDRYKVWLEMNNVGHIASGTTGVNYVPFCLNDLFAPMNTSSPLPNPINAVAAVAPTGLQNLLYNSTTTTGLWQYYRVWRVITDLTVTPGALIDNCYVGVYPNFVGAESADTGQNIATIGQLPNSKIIQVSSAQDKQNLLRTNWSLPQILGVPNKDYAAMVNTTFGSYTTPPTQPVNCEFVFHTTGGSVLTANLGWNLRVKFFVEFFGRTDYTLETV